MLDVIRRSSYTYVNMPIGHLILSIITTTLNLKFNLKIQLQKLQNFLTTSLTFGTNTKHNVAVVQKIIKNESKTKTKSLRSESTNEIAAPVMHVMKTL